MTNASISLKDARAAISDHPPLVVCYTNSVTVDAVANTTLHWGGLPVMSEDEREAADMIGIAGACLINMGTVNATSEERVITAGRAAAREDIPVVFDPVGVGATSMRTRVAERIIDEVDVAVVKGNYGEITALAGSDAEVRGVESIGEYTEIAETAIACARKSNAVVVASGETDIVADRERAFEISAGDSMMGTFVGSGCMLGVTLATFAGGLGHENAFEAAVAGTTAFGIAGERAATEGSWNGPASYKIAFLDSIAELDAAAVEEVAVEERIEQIVDI